MICLHSTAPGGADREFAALLDAEWPPAADGHSAAAGFRGELAEAVADFLRSQAPGPAPAGGWPTGYLLMLIGRVLWSLGEEPAARRLLAVRGRDCRLPDICIEAACAPDSSMACWNLLLTARAVRGTSSPLALQGAAWVLDLERLFRSAGVRLEAAAMNLADAVIERVAGVWDRAGGQGFLGLRRAEAAAACVMDCPTPSARTAALAGEFRAGCAARLRMLRRRRGWRHVPAVMILEL